MKKYKVTYLRRFTGKNDINYCALEITSVEASKGKDSGVYFGHRTYSFLVRAENFPINVLPDDYIKCIVSFDNETGKPFAYAFSKCYHEEAMLAIEEEYNDAIAARTCEGGEE